MNSTQIEWVQNPDGTPGYTWNPITGCLNHVNGMCKGGGFPCYAYRLAQGRLRSLYLANRNIAIPEGVKLEIFKGHDGVIVPYQDPFYPRFWPERLDEIKPIPEYAGRFSNEVKNKLIQQKRKGIFVCDMGELFGGWIPHEWQEQIFRVITLNPWHRFFLLTKQPQNLIKFSPFPDNVYLGVTVTNQEMLDKAIDYLKMVDAKVKFLSMEPLLGRINLDL